MRVSWKLGRVAGIDLYLHPSFLLALAYIGGVSHFSVSIIVLYLLVFGCVLLHEYGHALTARRFGIETVDITIYPIGGVARLARLPRAAGAELLIALAGPAVNGAIALALWAGIALLLDAGVSSKDGVIEFCKILLGANIFLGLFNMIPAFPMDGGRVLRALLSGRLGRLRATEIAASLGRAIVLAFAISLPFWTDDFGTLIIRLALAVFIYKAAGMELRNVRLQEAVRSPNEQAVQPPLGYVWVRQGDGVWRLAPASFTATVGMNGGGPGWG